MRYPHTKRQAELVALAAGLARQIAPRAREHDREGTIPVDSYRDLIDAKYQTLTVPSERGGMGVDMIEFVLAQNALAQGDESAALGINMHLMSVANASQPDAWPRELYLRVMYEVVEERALINSAAAEPEMGSPAGGGRPLTMATACKGGWLWDQKLPRRNSPRRTTRSRSSTWRCGSSAESPCSERSRWNGTIGTYARA
jgi:alkylation response protein AidB-like acyl-CoA dehydrogenase